MSAAGEQPIATTVIDVFDKRRSLRQGTFDCLLHTEQSDRNFALVDTNKTCVKVNNILRQIHAHKHEVDQDEE
jgi:hypothetical protein